MSLRIVVLEHEPETGLGAFAAVLDEAQVDYELVETLSGPLPDAGLFDGAIALGGSLNAYDRRLLETRRWIRTCVLRGLPFLGVCLGGQLLASALGAPVERQARPELGVHDVYLTDAARRHPLFSGLPGRLAVFGWHEDGFELPQGAVPLVGSIACTYEAFRFDAVAYGFEFHPEVRAGDLASWARVPGYRRLLDAASVTPDHLAGELARAAPSWTSSRASCSSAGSSLPRESPRSASGGWKWRSDRDARSVRQRAPRDAPLDELTATLWCLAVLLAVPLAAYWFAAAIYSN